MLVLYLGVEEYGVMACHVLAAAVAVVAVVVAEVML